MKDEYASVCLRTTILNAGKTELTVVTDIMDADGQVVSTKTNKGVINHGQPFTQNFIVERPKLWSPETPVLYKAVSKIYSGDTLLDTYSTRFGIRTIEYIADKGFYLNGKRRKFQGVCNHHDLGPLGAAINVAALRHQLTLLKEMGCDAIRTSHNMPAPELVELCDEMGFMMMLEPFDEWDIAKCDNGYHRFFNEWAEKDMVNMLRQYRNNPCVVMWSIGNEVPTQWSPEGYKVAKFLQDICHREDPTRPVTCGMDQVKSVLANGFAAMLDIPGLNYRAHLYDEAYERLPQNIILGSETSSTVSSRGVYKFPVERKAGAMYDDHQSSSYDLEYCNWSNIPDIDLRVPKIMNGQSDSLCGLDSTIWASRARMIPMHGRIIVQCSVSSIWHLSPKTVIICTEVYGIKKQKHCISCRTGIGKDVKVKRLLFLFIQTILRQNCLSTEKAMDVRLNTRTEQ